MTELPIQRFLLEAIGVLNRLGIPYVIMGGFAVRTWGVPRPTYDADLAISVDESRMQLLLRSLEEAGFEVPEEYTKGFLDIVAGMEKARVTRFESRTVWDVDLFIVRGPFLESALARGLVRQLEGRDVRVMSPEDVVLLKLIAHRRKDQLDVEEILRITLDLDRDHLRQWADHLGVSERLETFLSELS